MTWVLTGTTRPVGLMDVWSGVDSTYATINDSQGTTGGSSLIAPALTASTPYAMIYNIWCGRNATGGPPNLTVPGTHTATGQSQTGFGGAAINSGVRGGYILTPGLNGTYGPYTASESVTSTHLAGSVALRPTNSTMLLF